MDNGMLGKMKGEVLRALLPTALIELLLDKGIITKEELNKAMAKVVLEVYSKQKAIKSKAKTKGGEESEK